MIKCCKIESYKLDNITDVILVELNSETVDPFPVPPVSSGSSKRKFKEKDNRDSVATRQDTKVSYVLNLLTLKLQQLKTSK